MISIVEFVVTGATPRIVPRRPPPAQSPMAGTNSYIQNRMQALKQMLSTGRISQAQYTQETANLRKNRFNRTMGVTTF